MIEFKTSKGTFKVQLFDKQAPHVGREFPAVRRRRLLRRHDFPPRDPGLHDPGRRLRPRT